MSVDSVIITGELFARNARPPNYQSENRLMRMLAAYIGESPRVVLNKLVATARTYCRAGSAGLSLLETNSDGHQQFRWISMAGKYRRFLGETTPVGFSPCGTCLERGTPQLYRTPSRYFTYFRKVRPSIYEGLVVPILAGAEKLGTIWIVSHERTRVFDSEDVRVMSNIAVFIAAILRQHQALELARRNQDFSGAVLGATPDCIKVLDDQARIIYMNEPGLKALGISALEVLNKNWLDFWNGESNNLAKRAFKAAQRGNSGQFQALRPNLNGEDRWWEVRITNLPLGKNDRNLYLCISKDVSERVTAAEKLLEAYRKLALHAVTLDSRVEERTRELQHAQGRTQALAQKLVLAQEDERRAIARELHDEVGQQLTGLKLILEQKDAPDYPGILRRGSGLVGAIQKHIQTLLASLRQSFPDHLTLRTALQWHFQQLRDLANLEVEFTCGPGFQRDLGPELNNTIFRIVQEALTNVLRHAKTRKAGVTLSRNNREILLTIVDEGAGIRNDNSPRRALSAGLLGMEERVLLLGGRFALKSRHGVGTTILVSLPTSNAHGKARDLV